MVKKVAVLVVLGFVASLTLLPPAGAAAREAGRPAGLTPAGAPASLQGDPLSVQQEFLEALNGGDLAGLRALITSDFVVRGNAICATPCPGTSQLEFFINLSLRVTVLSTQVSGNTAISQVVAESPIFPALPQFSPLAPAVDRVFAETRLTVRDGKASALEINLDLNDPRSAAVANALRSLQQQVDPLTLQRQFINALNRGDLATLRTLIAPDFFVQGNAVCATPCPGTIELEFFITIGLKVTVLSSEISGESVISDVAAESPFFATLVPEVTRVFATTTLRVRGGKAVSLSVQLDLSDSRTRALATALRAAEPTSSVAPPPVPAPAAPAPAAAPVALPRTGSAAGSESSRLVREAMAGAGLLLLVVGLLAAGAVAGSRQRR
jgi:hypothetical protein